MFPVGQKAHTVLADTGSMLPPRPAEQGVGSSSKVVPSFSDRQRPVLRAARRRRPWTPSDGAGAPSSSQAASTTLHASLAAVLLSDLHRTRFATAHRAAIHHRVDVAPRARLQARDVARKADALPLLAVVVGRPQPWAECPAVVTVGEAQVADQVRGALGVVRELGRGRGDGAERLTGVGGVSDQRCAAGAEPIGAQDPVLRDSLTAVTASGWKPEGVGDVGGRLTGSTGLPKGPVGLGAGAGDWLTPEPVEGLGAEVAAGRVPQPAATAAAASAARAMAIRAPAVPS